MSWLASRRCVSRRKADSRPLMPTAPPRRPSAEGLNCGDLFGLCGEPLGEAESASLSVRMCALDPRRGERLGIRVEDASNWLSGVQGRRRSPGGAAAAASASLSPARLERARSSRSRATASLAPSGLWTSSSNGRERRREFFLGFKAPEETARCEAERVLIEERSSKVEEARSRLGRDPERSFFFTK